MCITIQEPTNNYIIKELLREFPRTFRFQKIGLQSVEKILSIIESEPKKVPIDADTMRYLKLCPTQIQ